MPAAPNVIPGSAILSLDVRHARDVVRRNAVRRLVAESAAIARRRGLRSSWKQTQDESAVSCSPKLSELLARSVETIQKKSPRLVSGAGHDAVVMAAVAEIALLFVRCRDGLSHHPKEFASRADLNVAVQVMIDFLERLAKPRGDG
jgi:allantoate deiminase